MRKPFIVANWKMHKTVQESADFVKAIKDHLPDPEKVEVGIAGQAFALYSMHEAAAKSGLRIIAQNAAPQLSGPFTGEISMRGLSQAGVSHVMLGHIERRRLFNETNEAVHQKVETAIMTGLTPIICTDETMVQREMNGEIHYVLKQLQSVLHGVSLDQIRDIIISYEPSWAVGVGQRANTALAEEGCRQIRRMIADIYTYEIADKIRILYGGSVNPKNIQEIMAKPDIDGVLIGRASLDVDNFLAMVNYQQQTK
ncbi:triose-phosphate isomerase [Limosilactobacillus coleohominis 101-4-CHN]|uniref:Triosephosphate isomerase n=1 Tax=Limosilactobacillus coleohominis 101-4-CHN TaxID=575594 RepID=C7XX29_9LACO|nr:triose-phosphate isomerase [Limosilactobacillus coleohominis]EEU29849.1 triose-phosphate isomerase [Limosilactobacillus coleohominis 101-4-CHN]